jgi:hypothetical protein
MPIQTQSLGIVALATQEVANDLRTPRISAAACFLYRDVPTIGGAEMDQVLAPTA